MKLLDRYEEVVGPREIQRLRQLAARLAGKRIVHVNSTRTGGGVAEILRWMVPLMQELGLDARWEVISGSPDFYRVTKAFHNGLQGLPVVLRERELRRGMRRLPDGLLAVLRRRRLQRERGVAELSGRLPCKLPERDV